MKTPCLSVLQPLADDIMTVVYGRPLLQCVIYLMLVINKINHIDLVLLNFILLFLKNQILVVSFLKLLNSSFIF